MRYLTFPLLVVFLMLSSCSGNAQSSSDAEEGTTIIQMSAAQAKAALDKGQVTVLDIRTPGEFASGHIQGAININFSSPDFASELSKLDRGHAYLVHCRSGGRSSRSLSTFKKLGFKEIDHLSGGILDWTRSGLPLTK